MFIRVQQTNDYLNIKYQLIMDIWAFGVCVVILITLYYRWMFGYWKSKNVKTLRPNILFGNLTDVLLGKIPVYKMFEKAYKTATSKGDKYIGFYFLGKPILLATHIDLINQVLITESTSFYNREFYLNKEQDPLSANLFAMRGADWKHMRGLLSPAFTASKMKTFYPILSSVGEQLKYVLDAAQFQPVNVTDVAGKFVFDSVGMCIFGLETNTLKNENLEFQKITEKFLGGSVVQNIKVVLSLINPNVLYSLRIPFNSQEVQDFFINLTKNTVEQREKNNIVRGDMMHMLIQMRNNINIEDNNKKFISTENKKGKSLTIEEIAAQTLLFFVAGYDTTATVVTNVLYELLRNESILEKALLEVNEVIDKYNGKITYEALCEMTYLENIINEAVRVYPVAPILSRTCTKNYKIPDSELVIEKGATIFIPAYEILHDSNYFEDPEEFIPERFSIGSDLKSHHKVSWLGFGEGPRRCIGERFGFLMAKTFLSIVLYHYKISFNPTIKLPLEIDKKYTVIRLKDALLVDFQRLNK